MEGEFFADSLKKIKTKEGSFMKSIRNKIMVLGFLGLIGLSFGGCNNPTTGTNTWTINGVTGPTIAYATNTVTIYAVLQSVQINAGVTVPLPNMPNSSIEVAPDVSGGLLLQATLDTNEVLALAGTNLLPATKLPGGRPLPGIAGGALPALAVQVPSWDNATFYVSSTVFGVFVPVKFNINQVIGTFNYFDSANKLVGEISIVGEDANKANSGFLLMLNIANVGMSMMEQNKLILK